MSQAQIIYQLLVPNLRGLHKFPPHSHRNRGTNAPSPLPEPPYISRETDIQGGPERMQQI